MTSLYSTSFFVCFSCLIWAGFLRTSSAQLSLSGNIGVRSILFPGDVRGDETDREDDGTINNGNCITSNGDEGTCVSISKCPSARGTFLFRPPVVCYWRDLEPVVCCQPDRETAGETGQGPDPRETHREGKKIVANEDRSSTSGGNANARLQSLRVPGCGRTLIVDDVPPPPPPQAAVSRTNFRSVFDDVMRPFRNIFGGVRQPPHFVVGGLEAKPHAWPWMAAIYLQSEPGNSGRRRFLCGGSLIDRRYVLTAAHCLASGRTPRSESNYVVLLGAHDVKDGRHFEVDKVIVHDRYTKGQYYNDIALLRLANDVRFSPEISPVCLPLDGSTDDAKLLGRNATVTGWGDLAFGGVNSKVLREVSIPIVLQDACNRNYSAVARSTFPEGISNGQICAGVAEGGKDACQGDSGGPLVMEDSRSNLYSIVGIVSFGFRCAVAGYPGVYTKVSSYLPWISQQTGGLRA